MDYDAVHWADNENGKFTLYNIHDSDMYYFNVDLYDMELLSADEVGKIGYHQGSSSAFSFCYDGIWRKAGISS
jgi:hypothetical protein